MQWTLTPRSCNCALFWLCGPHNKCDVVATVWQIDCVLYTVSNMIHTINTMCMRSILYCLHRQSRGLWIPQPWSDGKFQFVYGRGFQSLEGWSCDPKTWFLCRCFKITSFFWCRGPEDGTTQAPPRPHWWCPRDVHMSRGSIYGSRQGHRGTLWPVPSIHAACLSRFVHPPPLAGAFRVHREEFATR